MEMGGFPDNVENLFIRSRGSQHHIHDARSKLCNLFVNTDDGGTPNF